MSVPMAVDDKVWELKFQLVTEKLDRLVTSMNEKMGGLNETVKTGYSAIYKMLDDHESRLRKRLEVDSAQELAISNLRVQMTTLEGQMRAVTLLIENANKREEERVSREVGFWQKTAFELFKIAMAAGTGGGAVYLLDKTLRLF